MAAPSAHAAPSTASRQVTDQQIENAISHSILTDAVLHAKTIDVTVTEGVAKLTGVIDSLIADDRAVRFAETTRGVRAVVDTIVLHPPARSDADLRKDVDAAFAYDAWASPLAIKADVKDGVVTISGELSQYRQKRVASDVAKGVKGVKGVTETFTLTGKTERSDPQILGEIRHAMATDAWLYRNLIQTEINRGVITLSGTVGTPAQHNRAIWLAWTAGVSAVYADGLHTEASWGEGTAREELIDSMSDSAIQQSVKDSLAFDPRVWSFRPRIDVENEVVTRSMESSAT
jgi:osmotically-inducible protein OsmY